jgi:hypothetical protein
VEVHDGVETRGRQRRGSDLRAFTASARDVPWVRAAPEGNIDVRLRFYCAEGGLPTRSWWPGSARHDEFEEVALVHLNALYNTALRLTGNRAEAEDVVQETYLKAVKSFHRFTGGTILADLEGLSYREVAGALGCPVGTVMSRLSRGRHLLRQLLFQFGREHGYVRDRE